MISSCLRECRALGTRCWQRRTEGLCSYAMRSIRIRIQTRLAWTARSEAPIVLLPQVVVRLSARICLASRIVGDHRKSVPRRCIPVQSLCCAGVRRCPLRLEVVSLSFAVASLRKTTRRQRATRLIGISVSANVDVFRVCMST